MTMFQYAIATLVALVCAIPSFAQQKPFTLSISGKPKAAIILSSDAVSAEKTAAKELSEHLNKITGASFPVYSLTNAPKGMPRIFVGQSSKAKKLLGNIDWKTLKYDGIIIRFVGKDLILAGDRPRGSLYAVYTFLEDYLGCRWLTPTANYIPAKASLSVKRINKTHIPPFMYRETYFFHVNHQNLVFASKLKLNGTYQSVPPEYGGHYKLIGFVHTFDELLPASKYLKEHPEWYSLVDGTRIGGQSAGQLCLTNEDMKAEFVKQALVAVEKDPNAGMISISQNDNISYCQCEKCMAVAKEEGNQSGLLLRFVNSVADEIVKKYPDFLIETLAYQYTRHAPKLTKPRNNVIVRLCSIECDFAKPLDTPSNSEFYKDIQDWKKLSKRLYVWDYVVNFSNLTIAHPNWRVLAPNIRIFAKNNVVGLFEQGDGFNHDAAFANMKMWILAHLMWDPAQDQNKLMKDFATRYYGPAAPYLLKYIDITCAAVEKSGSRLTCSNASNVDYLDQNTMDESTVLFDKAEESVVNNTKLLERMRLERLALEHTWVLQTKLDRSIAGKARSMDMNAIAENFINKSQSNANRFISENIPMSDEYNNGLRIYAGIAYIPPTERAAKYPEFLKDLNPDQWMELQENRINMYRPGLKSFITKDSDASDGIAIRMPGNMRDWASQMFLDRTNYAPGTKVDIYMSVKVDLKATSGVAFSIGIYDDNKLKRILDKDIRIEDVKDSKYHDYHLGTYTMEPGWFVYVAPPGDSALAENVFVDRGFVVKVSKE